MKYHIAAFIMLTQGYSPAYSDENHIDFDAFIANPQLVEKVNLEEINAPLPAPNTDWLENDYYTCTSKNVPPETHESEEEIIRHYRDKLFPHIKSLCQQSHTEIAKKAAAYFALHIDAVVANELPKELLKASKECQKQFPKAYQTVLRELKSLQILEARTITAADNEEFCNTIRPQEDS